ncbi:MAG: UDP-N-acetylmuramoyl-L-alanine--D-glutamate ligase [Bacteroidia bacterium]|nr:UDP-N-acetylmuramoyl-L-alanine--D-glutamate ligase [Bacteroidia bacterium]
MKKRIVVLGAGESGAGAAVLAKKEGYDVFVSDSGIIKEKYKNIFSERRIEFEEKHHTMEKILSADEIIKSPGISEATPVMKMISEKKIAVCGEIEFASRFTNAKLIAITGTNGKTTTTLLIHYILTKGGLKAGLTGNVGHSLAMMVAENPQDYYVIELSSFQLDDMKNFKADISVLLNITPDHLDRYKTLGHYIDSKFSVTRNQTAQDAFIYCDDDELITENIQRQNIRPQRYPFSIKKKISPGAFLDNNEIIIELNPNQIQFAMSIYNLSLQGKHNIYNSMAASVAANILGIRKEIIRDCLSDFRNAEHRLEFVATVHGVDYVNDSKATNINSTWYALESFHKPLVLILGGIDKGNDYKMLKDLVKEKVKAIICLGKDNKKIHRAFNDVVKNIVDASSADEAVTAAKQFAEKGDVVLLSPACASFDLFENYEDRGRKFKNAVKAL